jgi:hypothetical protein
MVAVRTNLSVAKVGGMTASSPGATGAAAAVALALLARWRAEAFG